LIVLRFVVGIVAIFCIGGCEKQAGEAVILAKEHIAAAAAPNEAPGTERAMPSEEYPRPIAADEIAVDGYVMKPGVRGTSRDPRALKDEQWIVKVRTIDDGRTFNVQAEQALFDKLKVNSRVRVSYRLGKYTKTVWDAQISN
jgi:hypothetical protein